MLKTNNKELHYITHCTLLLCFRTVNMHVTSLTLFMKIDLCMCTVANGITRLKSEMFMDITTVNGS